MQLHEVNRINTRQLKKKAQISLPSPFTPQNRIEHAVREWEVQWVRSPEAKPDLEGRPLMPALLALKA